MPKNQKWDRKVKQYFKDLPKMNLGIPCKIYFFKIFIPLVLFENNELNSSLKAFYYLYE